MLQKSGFNSPVEVCIVSLSHSLNGFCKTSQVNNSKLTRKGNRPKGKLENKFIVVETKPLRVMAVMAVRYGRFNQQSDAFFQTKSSGWMNKPVLKNVLVKLVHFPRVENKTCLKPHSRDNSVWSLAVHTLI